MNSRQTNRKWSQLDPELDNVGQKENQSVGGRVEREGLDAVSLDWLAEVFPGPQPAADSPAPAS